VAELATTLLVADPHWNPMLLIEMEQLALAAPGDPAV